MGISKVKKYSEQKLNLSLYAKALAHPARLAIIDYLVSKQDCVCGDIVDNLPIAQSTVSQHLKELKKAGLIQGTIQGPKTCYCLNVEVWQKAQNEFNKLFQSIERHKFSCC